MNKNYSEIYNKTKDIVNDWDPCSFIESGAPDDEYESLINKLISGIINKTEFSKIRLEIIELLENYYGLPILSELDENIQEKLKIEIDTVIKSAGKTNANNV